MAINSIIRHLLIIILHYSVLLHFIPNNIQSLILPIDVLYIDKATISHHDALNIVSVCVQLKFGKCSLHFNALFLFTFLSQVSEPHNFGILNGSTFQFFNIYFYLFVYVVVLGLCCSRWIP